jgi:hypothetical protein
MLSSNSSSLKKNTGCLEVVFLLVSSLMQRRLKLSVMFHTCNPRPQEDKEEDLPFQASLGYVAGLCVKTNKQTKKPGRSNTH